MKKKTSDSLSPQEFEGHCNQCGETYGAQSKSDDLEGVTFKCKKMLCSGRVTLEQRRGLTGRSISIPLKEDHSKRFC